MQNDRPVRGQILDAALEATLKSRNASYGDPFPNMGLAAELKAAYRRVAGKKYHPAHDDAIEMVLSKIARIASGAPGHTDNYVDGAAYMAIASECQTSFEVIRENAIAAASQYAKRMTPDETQD